MVRKSHVEMARDRIDAADSHFQRGNSPESGLVQATVANTYALLALVEVGTALLDRLDSMTTNGLDGQKALNVMAGLVRMRER